MYRLILYVDSDEENEGIMAENKIEQQIRDCSPPEPEKEKEETPTQEQVQISGATLIEELIESVSWRVVLGGCSADG